MPRNVRTTNGAAVLRNDSRAICGEWHRVVKERLKDLAPACGEQDAKTQSFLHVDVMLNSFQHLTFNR